MTLKMKLYRQNKWKTWSLEVCVHYEWKNISWVELQPTPLQLLLQHQALFFVCLNIIDEVTLGPGTTAAAVWCLHHVTDNPANRLVFPPLCPLLSPSFLPPRSLLTLSCHLWTNSLILFFPCSSAFFMLGQKLDCVMVGNPACEHQPV